MSAKNLVQILVIKITLHIMLKFIQRLFFGHGDKATSKLLKTGLQGSNPVFSNWNHERH